MQFKEVVGQKKLKQKLIRSFENGRISHAQLFLGNCGYGSLPLAIAYAQFINCTNRNEADSCGICSSCIKMEKLAHPDVHYSFPVNTNKEIKAKPVSDNFIKFWREINLEEVYFSIDNWHRKIDIEQKQSIINVQESQQLIKKLSLKPFEAEYKILIIFKAENINPQASNKLLKLIEEPTDKTLIILIAEEEEQLMKTITSRTQIVRVPPIEDAEISKYLVHNKHQDIMRADDIAALAEGNLLGALSRLEQSEEEELFFELFKTWMRACYEASIEKIYNWVEEVSSRSFGREKQKRFIAFTLELMREGLIRNYSSVGLKRAQGEISDFLFKFSPFINGNNTIAIMELLDKAHAQISRNAYSKILFMDMSLKFANLLRVKASNMQ